MAHWNSFFPRHLEPELELEVVELVLKLHDAALCVGPDKSIDARRLLSELGREVVLHVVDDLLHMLTEIVDISVSDSKADGLEVRSPEWCRAIV